MTGLTVVALATVAGLVWVLGPGSRWILENYDNIHGLPPDKLATAVDNIRGRALAIATGIAALVAVYYTARNATTARRNLELSERNLRSTVELSDRTYRLSEQGHVTDRYTKAIEQLGSDKLDIRLGGIYALERIARDSARDHPTVMDVLAAFVRGHANEIPADESDAALLGIGPLPKLRIDLQTAVTVIGRRERLSDAGRINLQHANLSRGDMRSAKLAGANLVHAELTDADLFNADLTGADLTGANLTHAHLADTDLRGADLTDANLTKAKASHADLRNADLSFAGLTHVNFRDADLTNADLTRADLRNADLAGANLSGANLTDANLSYANLSFANLDGAKLSYVKLDGANLFGAKGMQGRGASRDSEEGSAQFPEGDRVSPIEEILGSDGEPEPGP